jgi:uncharacterized protein
MQNLLRFYQLEKFIKPNQVVVIYGPRRVGKTTLLNKFLQKSTLNYRLDTGDDTVVQEALSSQNLKLIKDYVADNQLIAIDEAQNIPNIGMALKLMVDQIPNIKIIVTGSSTFELAGQVGEPLTGRKQTLTLYPVAQLELLKQHSLYDLKQNLSDYLIFGSYPKVITSPIKQDKRQVLEEIVNSYLFKDILAFEKVKSAKTLLDLLRLLAFQVGSEVSLTELGAKLALDYKTVARYLDLFEKSFILINLRGFSKNLRKEITKKSKYYFWDLGLRNAIISNFNNLELRDDIGKLWENFLVIERLKKQQYHQLSANNFFWRTWGKNEIDWVEEREGKLFGYEFTYSQGHKKTVPSLWKETYNNSQFKVIDQTNYLDFIT